MAGLMVYLAMYLLTRWLSTSKGGLVGVGVEVGMPASVGVVTYELGKGWGQD